MTQLWLLKPKALLFMSLMLALVLVIACGSSSTSAPDSGDGPPQSSDTQATPVPTTASVDVAPKVNRLVYAIAEVSETNRHWTVSRPAYYQYDPYLETLVDLAPMDNSRIPRLSTSWSSADDASSWTFNLQEGVQFHNGWGEFTSQDVMDAQKRLTSEESTSASKNFWERVVNIEAVSDHELVINMDGPAVNMPAMASRGFGGGELMMMSKAQIDAEGYEGIDDKPAGTGPYAYKEREFGQGITFELAEGDHWRGEEPAFPELEIRFVREDATRLAMLLSEEAHMADLSRELQIEALQQGMRNIPSSVPTNWLTLFWGGLYFADNEFYPEDIRDSVSLDLTVPWTDKRVRQAMNKAINRQELMDFVLRGSGDFMYNTAFHPGLEGWNPAWESDFEDLYGYDPDAAKALLADAGYGPDNPIDIKIYNYTSAGEPETPVMVEALINYWEPVGINVTVEDSEWGRVRETYRSRGDDIKCCAWGNVVTMRSMLDWLRLKTTTGGARSFETNFIEENYKAMIATSDPAEIDRLARAIGDHLYYEFEDVPLFWFSLEITVNPEVVGDWTFPGTAGSKSSHFNLITPAQ